MQCRSAPCAGSLDILGDKLMLAKRRREIERHIFEDYIKEMIEQDKEEGTKTIPPTRIVKYYGRL